MNHEVFRALRATMAEVRPDAWLVAEHCYDATADLAGDGWHGVMAYSWFLRPVWSWLCPARRRADGVPPVLPRIGADGLVAACWRSPPACRGAPWRRA